MERLVITLTRWNVMVEYDGDHGVTSAFKNYRQYNSQFNYGYGGGGPMTLVKALLEVLYMQSEREIYEKYQSSKGIPGYEIVKSLVTETKNPNTAQSPLCGQLVIDITEEMISLFPFLQQKKDLFGKHPVFYGCKPMERTSIGFFVKKLKTLTLKIKYTLLICTSIKIIKVGIFSAVSSSSNFPQDTV